MALSETITSLGSAIINFVNAKITNAIQIHNADIQEQIEDLQEQINNSGYIASSPFSLFDTKIVDRILTGNEAIGWALQGSLVTNTYPDAVSKIKQEYNEGTNEIYLETTDIVLPTFTANTTNGITVSDARNSTTAWNLINGQTSRQIGAWDTYWFNIDYGQDVVLTQYSIKADSNGSPEYPTDWTLQASNDGSIWEIIDTQTEQVFTLGQEKNFIVDNSTPYKQYRLVFSAGLTASGGGELGKLNFSAYHIDMQFNYRKHSNGHNLVDIAEKSEVDKYYNKYGICDFYIVDLLNNQFYLPKTKYFWQFTDNTHLVNSYIEAGLPNITGGVKVGGIGSQPIALQNATGAFTLTESDRYMTRSENSGNQPSRFELDASLSNAIYGNSETVQPPASNKLLYYCIGSTIINEGDIDAANLINDISSVVNQMSNKCEKDLSNCTKPYINETYKNGTSWYRIWSDGWIEQGGVVSVTSAGQSLAYLKSFADTTYTIVSGGSSNTLGNTACYNKTISGCQLYTGDDDSFNAGILEWYACGY